jgi:HlyD family secretion protein
MSGPPESLRLVLFEAEPMTITPIRSLGPPRRNRARMLGAGLALALPALASSCAPRLSAVAEDTTTVDGFAVVRKTFVRTLRLHGTLESVDSFTVAAPRLAGPGSATLVLTRLVSNGARVASGDLLVEFDRQDQMNAARDRRAEWRDFEEQIAKKRAEQIAARAADQRALEEARSQVSRARFDLLKADLLPDIEVEKNRQAFEEAEATFNQLTTTADLKVKARAADLRILEIQRDRARTAMRHAEQNAERLSIRSPVAGLAVIKSVWKGSQMGEVQEGEEVRPGVPIVQVIDPSRMRVRVRVNQADIQEIRSGQSATVHFDAYPDLTLPGLVEQVAPIGVTSGFSSQVRTFVALVLLGGTDGRLTPDLSAAVDVELARQADALVIPLDAVMREGDRTLVRLSRNGRTEDREVTLGPAGDYEAVVTSGLAPGDTVRRGVASSVPVRDR